MNRLSWLLIFLLLPQVAFAGEFDRDDQLAFGFVVAAQIMDGLTTMSSLKDPEQGIIREWNWMYGGRCRPSPERFWITRAATTGIIYMIARALPKEHRQPFLLVVGGFILSCAMNNKLEFSIKY